MCAAVAFSVVVGLDGDDGSHGDGHGVRVIGLAVPSRYVGGADELRRRKRVSVA